MVEDASRCTPQGIWVVWRAAARWRPGLTCDAGRPAGRPWLRRPRRAWGRTAGSIGHSPGPRTTGPAGGGRHSPPGRHQTAIRSVLLCGRDDARRPTPDAGGAGKPVPHDAPGAARGRRRRPHRPAADAVRLLPLEGGNWRRGWLLVTCYWLLVGPSQSEASYARTNS
jgi:hypothetical protein